MQGILVNLNASTNTTLLRISIQSAIHTVRSPAYIQSVKNALSKAVYLPTYIESGLGALKSNISSVASYAKSTVPTSAYFVLEKLHGAAGSVVLRGMGVASMLATAELAVPIIASGALIAMTCEYMNSRRYTSETDTLSKLNSRAKLMERLYESFLDLDPYFQESSIKSDAIDQSKASEHIPLACLEILAKVVDLSVYISIPQKTLMTSINTIRKLAFIGKESNRTAKHFNKIAEQLVNLHKMQQFIRKMSPGLDEASMDKQQIEKLISTNEARFKKKTVEFKKYSTMKRAIRYKKKIKIALKKAKSPAIKQARKKNQRRRR